MEEHNEINYKEFYEKVLIENNILKERLKKYTSPSRNKTFYQNHKEDIIKKVKEYNEKTGYNWYNNHTLEEKKEYNKKLYEKRKLKKLEENKVDNKIYEKNINKISDT